MRLTEDIINDIRNSASITEVIGHYIPLIKKGKGYTAVCPFHDDHDPSLSISEDKQIYKCFVCGNGGNAFNFVMNFKKVSFPESVVEVADIVGKPLDIEVSRAPKKVDKNQKYYDLLNSFVDETNYLLTATKAGEMAKKYLENRGINKDIINKFNIGYNPNDDFLYKYLHESKFNDEDILTTGIGRMTDRGIRDAFYNRIIFPIHDKNGNPIAFSARIFDGTSDSKYINTGETLIYTKGDNLYNYHRAKESAKKENSLIICEGTMDVIAYDRAGITNVVAMLGTALTKNQLELLKSLSNNIVLSFDGDKAGQAANIKNGEIALKYGLNVSVIDNNTGLDPDEIINKHGDKALRELSNKRLSYIDYAIKYYKNQLNLDNYNDRKTLHQKITSLIDLLQDAYDKQNYTNELYELTKIRRIETGSNNKIEYNKTQVIKTYKYTLDGLTKAEYAILVMMSMSKDASNHYQRDLGFLTDSSNQKLAMYIIDEYRKNGECRLSALLDEVEDIDVKNLIITLATLEGLPDKYDKVLFNSAIEKVKHEIKLKKLADLTEKITKYSDVDQDKTSEYLIEYQSLLRELGGKNNGK